jgi:pimeloyl-ACP methyl ester carboxylesterase
MRVRTTVTLVATIAVPLTFVGCRALNEPANIERANFARAGDQLDENSGPVITIDHRVPHTSTVPANAGELAHLFVRERVRSDIADGKPRQAVLMIHGRSVPVLAGMELQHDDYDWALWLARSGGFDVFMMDFQGSGRSPRPRMDDPCNVPTAQQQRLLVPNPLSATCAHSYALTLNTSASDLDELDTVVEYIRHLRGVDKVHLVGWSQASFRIGPYAVQHPDKVASLFFFAPVFNTDFQGTPVPSESTPMTLTTRADVFTSNPSITGWSTCPDQREPGIEDIIWAAIMENDELGRTWGAPPAGSPLGSTPEGVMRVRQAILSGWNADVASRLTIPTLIIRGEFDTGLGGRQDVAQLYGLVQNDNKLRFTVQCAGHFMVWEKQRWILHQISKEWIKHGRVYGFEHGEFFVDSVGNLR